jgi:hypothetical protein
MGAALSVMKLRLQNSGVWVVSEGAVPEGAYFDVAFCADDVVVTPGWESAIAYFCDSAGNKLD